MAMDRMRSSSLEPSLVVNINVGPTQPVGQAEPFKRVGSLTLPVRGTPIDSTVAPGSASVSLPAYPPLFKDLLVSQLGFPGVQVVQATVSPPKLTHTAPARPLQPTLVASNVTSIGSVGHNYRAGDRVEILVSDEVWEAATVEEVMTATKKVNGVPFHEGVVKVRCDNGLVTLLSTAAAHRLRKSCRNSCAGSPTKRAAEARSRSPSTRSGPSIVELEESAEVALEESPRTGVPFTSTLKSEAQVPVSTTGVKAIEDNRLLRNAWRVDDLGVPNLEPLNAGLQPLTASRSRPRQTKTKDVDWSLQIGRPTFFAYFAGCINGLCSSDAVASKKPPPAPWSSLGLASPGSDFDLRPIEAEKNEVVLIVDETLDTYTSPKPATLADGPIEAETVQSATVVVEPLVIAPHVLLMKAKAPVVAPTGRYQLQKDMNFLTQHFGCENGKFGGYHNGELLMQKGDTYIRDYFGLFDTATYKFEAPDGNVVVWRCAIDLRKSTHDMDFKVLYHFTDEMGFVNIVGCEKSINQIFASFKDRAHFGDGVYATQHEPAVWNSRGRCLLNNYDRGDPTRPNIDDDTFKNRDKEWGTGNKNGHRVAFCVPLLVPKGSYFNVQEDGPKTHIAAGHDVHGNFIHEKRDVWVIKYKKEKDGKEASADDSDSDIFSEGDFEIDSDTDSDCGSSTSNESIAHSDSGSSTSNESNASSNQNKPSDICNAGLEAQRLLKCMRKRSESIRKKFSQLISVTGADNNMKIAILEERFDLLYELGNRYLARGLHEEALSKMEDCKKLGERHFGKQHQFTLLARDGVGRAQLAQGNRFPQAVETLQGAKRSAENLGKKHPVYMRCTFSLVPVLQQLSRQGNEYILEDARQMFKETFEHYEEWLGERGEKFPDIEALKQMRRHASLLYSKNDKDAKDEALSMLNDVMVQREKKLGKKHAETGLVKRDLANLWAACTSGISDKYYVDAMEICNKELGRFHVDSLRCLSQRINFLVKPDYTEDLVHELMIAIRRILEEEDKKEAESLLGLLRGPLQQLLEIQQDRKDEKTKEVNKLIEDLEKEWEKQREGMTEKGLETFLQEYAIGMTYLEISRVEEAKESFKRLEEIYNKLTGKDGKYAKKKLMDAKYNLAFLELDAKCSKKKLRELLKSCGNDTEAISEQMKKMEGMMVLYGEQGRKYPKFLQEVLQQFEDKRKELEDATKDDKSPTLESEARKVMEKVEEDVEEDGDEEESAERNEEKDLVPELEASLNASFICRQASPHSTLTQQAPRVFSSPGFSTPAPNFINQVPRAPPSITAAFTAQAPVVFSSPQFSTPAPTFINQAPRPMQLSTHAQRYDPRLFKTSPVHILQQAAAPRTASSFQPCSRLRW
ncbi:Nephrocystin-3 [Durusdinium trenchii]